MELIFLKQYTPHIISFVFGIGGTTLLNYLLNKNKNKIDTETTAFELYKSLLNNLQEYNKNIISLEKRVKELELLVIEKDRKIDELLNKLKDYGNDH